MKILYDATIFSSQRVGGISRYHYELYKGTRNLNFHPNIAGLFTKNKYTLTDPILKKALIKDSMAAFATVNKFLLKRALKKADQDTIYHPSILYRQVFDVIPKDIKVVMTIHDMIIERETKQIDELRLDYANRADKIIAISQTTKDDIIDILKIPEEKIEVIYHGCSLSLKGARKPKTALPDKYILYVGGRGKHKNLPFLLSSIADILHKNEDLYIVFTGNREFSEEEIQLLQELDIENKVKIMTRLEDEELAYVYSKSLAFIFPSILEGFGIPILEAWSCQTPALLSENKCFKEIGGDAAIYFDPYCKKSLENAVNDILNNEDMREEMIKKGTKRLELFSWKKASKQVADVYKSVLQEN